MVERISSHEFRAHERLSHWSEVISRTYARAEARYLGEQPFHGEVAVSDLGGVLLTDIGSEPMRYDRERRALTADGCNSFFVGYTVSGCAAVEQNGRQSRQQVGQVVAYDSGRPYTNLFPQRYRQVVLIVPRAQMVARLPDIDRVTSTTLEGTSPAGRMTRSLFQELATYQDQLPPQAAARMATSVLDMLALAMEVELLREEAPLRGAPEKLRRIKRYLTDHLETSPLPIERIASDNAVSVRTLHRLFAANGEAVHHWLYEQRLHAGYRALAEGRIGQVTEAATRFGFADSSHFAKAFKKTFGIQPSTLLRGAAPVP